VPYKKSAKIIKKVKRQQAKEFRLVRSVFGGFTPTLATKIKYIEYVDFDAGATTSAVYVFRANNPYDPNYTGTGHQPMWWDTYSNIYSQCRVTKSSITMTDLFNKIVNVAGLDATGGTTTGAFTHYGFANERSGRLFIIRDASPTDYPTDITTLIEQGATNFKTCWSPISVDNKMTQLSYTCVPSIQTDSSYKDSNLSMATSGTTPIDFKELYFICGVASLDYQNNPLTKRCMIEIDYDVEFFDRKTNQSQQ